MDYRMPLYIQLQDSIIKKIDEKKYLPGEAIPSERKMAEAYGVNRMTVKRAISKLVEEGYLVCKPGSGTRLKRLAVVTLNGAERNVPVVIQMKQEIPASQRRSVRVEWR